jgi:RimJ/RimL family protein N-acetyltransferase
LACQVDNAASRRVAEKCEFVFVGQDGEEYKFERHLDPADGPVRTPAAQPPSS